MELSRVLIMSIVFLIIWKDTLSQQTHRGNHLLIRSRRNHESDNIARVKTTNNEGESKKKTTEPVKLTNFNPRVQTRSSNLGKVPLKIVRIKPLHVRNGKNIDSIQPDVLFANNVGLADKNYNQSEVNNTQINHITEAKEVEENKLVVDEVVNKKLTINSEINSNENFENFEEELSNLKPKEPQIIKSKVKTKPRKVFKTRKPYDEKNIEKETVTLLKDPDSSLNEKNDEINNDDKNQNDKKTKDVPIQQEQITENVKIESIVVPEQDDKIPTKKRPFLEAIQNDLHISKNNSADDVSILRSGNDEALEKSTCDFKLVDKLVLSQNEKNDEDESILVTKNNYEEVMEIGRLPNVPISYQMNTLQNTIKPVSYDYNNQVPHIEEVTLADSNNNDNPYAENKERIDQIDGASVVSYNNYFKLPTTYSNWNNRNPSLYNLNNYGKYGDQGYGRPSSNNWNYDNLVYRNDKDKVWRSWQKTIYYSKSKNALKPLGDEKLFNAMNQNNADNNQYIQRRSNGYYRNQNTFY